MKQRNDTILLLHIRDSIERVQRYTVDGKDAFLADTKTQDAVIRNIEIIGEAVKQLSQEFKSAHSEIPWKQIAGMRDKLIHEYFGVNVELVWGVIDQHLPTLLAKVSNE